MNGEEIARKLISYKSTRFCRMTSPCRFYKYLWRDKMFKTFRKNCCGLDVHKTWIYACIGITDANSRTDYKEARFSSFSKGLRELAEWLALHSCTDVCIESAGKYWISCSMFLKNPAMSFLLISSTPNRREVTKPTTKTPNRSVTCSCAI